MVFFLKTVDWKTRTIHYVHSAVNRFKSSKRRVARFQIQRILANFVHGLRKFDLPLYFYKKDLIDLKLFYKQDL